MVDELVERLFAGDPAALVNHLVSDGRIEPDELERLQRLLEAADEREEKES